MIGSEIQFKDISFEIYENKTKPMVGIKGELDFHKLRTLDISKRKVIVLIHGMMNKTEFEKSTLAGNKHHIMFIIKSHS